MKPVTVFRGNLVLGDPELKSDTSFGIPVHVFNKVAEFKVAPAKKWNPRVQDSDPIPDHSITIQREYVYKDSEEGEDDLDALPADMEKDALIKAYRYGRRIVPVYPDDEEAWKLRTEKGMSILGFVSLNDVVLFIILSRRFHDNLS